MRFSSSQWNLPSTEARASWISLASIVCSQMFTSNHTKEAAFCGLWGGAAHRWFNGAISPPLWKGQFTTGNRWSGGKDGGCGPVGRCIVGNDNQPLKETGTECTKEAEMSRNETTDHLLSQLRWSQKSVLQGQVVSVFLSERAYGSFSGSAEASFASANETAPGWSLSPWQQAVSTSLTAISAAWLSVCLPSSACCWALQLTPAIGSSSSWQSEWDKGRSIKEESDSRLVAVTTNSSFTRWAVAQWWQAGDQTTWCNQTPRAGTWTNGGNWE